MTPQLAEMVKKIQNGLVDEELNDIEFLAADVIQAVVKRKEELKYYFNQLERKRLETLFLKAVEEGKFENGVATYEEYAGLYLHGGFDNYAERNNLSPLEHFDGAVKKNEFIDEDWNKFWEKARELVEKFQ